MEPAPHAGGPARSIAEANLKHAWKTIEHRLEEGNALQLQLFRDRKLDGLRRGLAPLCWGQSLQMVFGVAVVVAAAVFWNRYIDEPAMLATGIVMHVYGVAALVCGGITLGLVSRIDYAAPVLKIQKQLASLRRFYVISGLCVGLPWALLWVALPVMLSRTAGRDLYACAPSFVFGSLAVGVLLLAAVGWFHRWSRGPRRPELARRMEDSVSGHSLRRAQAAPPRVRRPALLDFLSEHPRTRSSSRGMAASARLSVRRPRPAGTRSRGKRRH